jgi:hypothetical protein
VAISSYQLTSKILLYLIFLVGKFVRSTNYGGLPMEIKYGAGLAFESDGDDQQEEGSSPLNMGKEAALQEIIRQGFRAPVGLAQQVTLTIAGNSYAVFNLSNSGVGIYLNEPGQFENNTRLEGMSLSIGGQTFTVEGKVVHLSSDGAHDLCGIELTSVTPECQKAISGVLQQSRNNLFSS